jgi:hypothetical protein
MLEQCWVRFKSRKWGAAMSPMVRNIAMLVLCLIAAGGFAAILFWTRRRLDRIEEEMWGEKAKQVRRDARGKAGGNGA